MNPALVHSSAICFVAIAFACCTQPRARPTGNSREATPRADAEKDPVLKAMLDELDRSMTQPAAPRIRQALLYPIPH